MESLSLLSIYFLNHSCLYREQFFASNDFMLVTWEPFNANFNLKHPWNHSSMSVNALRKFLILRDLGLCCCCCLCCNGIFKWIPRRMEWLFSTKPNQSKLGKKPKKKKFTTCSMNLREQKFDIFLLLLSVRIRYAFYLVHLTFSLILLFLYRVCENIRSHTHSAFT